MPRGLDRQAEGTLVAGVFAGGRGRFRGGLPQGAGRHAENQGHEDTPRDHTDLPTHRAPRRTTVLQAHRLLTVERPPAEDLRRKPQGTGVAPCRRDRVPTITVRGDIAEGLQPPDVSAAVLAELRPVIDRLPAGYRLEEGGITEESRKASNAILPLVPIMLALTLLIIILQVRSMSAMAMVFATAPLGLIGVVPTLLMFQQPFGINALVGLIALSGILMRNTLILLGQVDHNLKEGLAPFDAVVEATVQRARPVILTALAAILAFIPLTHSVFWGTLAYTLIGGTFAGTVLTLVFLPAMYAIWFRIVPRSKDEEEAGRGPSEQTRVRDRTDVRVSA